MLASAAREHELRREELIAARLLTGPMRTKYNLVLRAAGSGAHVAKAACAEVCGTNGYGVTLRLLNSAISKLARLTTPTAVWRGLGGGVLPQALWRPDQRNVRGGVEAGVLSCVREADAALLLVAAILTLIFGSILSSDVNAFFLQ